MFYLGLIEVSKFSLFYLFIKYLIQRKQKTGFTYILLHHVCIVLFHWNNHISSLDSSFFVFRVYDVNLDNRVS